MKIFSVLDIIIIIIIIIIVSFILLTWIIQLCTLWECYFYVFFTSSDYELHESKVWVYSSLYTIPWQGELWIYLLNE